MRYIKVRLSPIEGELHPIEEAIVAQEGISRKAIHHFDILEDETAITLYELEGDRDAGLEVVDHPDIISYSVSESGSSLFSYTHFRPNETAKTLYQVGQLHELIVETPIPYGDDGALVATVIGNIERARDAIPDLPSNVHAELLEIGEYVPGEEQMFHQLTDRQQDVLRAAVEVGYYENPRHKTYDDIAEEIDLSAGTVGEHLRKIESRVFNRMVPEK